MLIAKITLSFFMILSVSFADSSTEPKDLLSRLQAYTKADIESDKNIKDPKKLNIEKMFKDLKEANKILVDGNADPQIILEAARVAELTAIHDTSSYAAEILMPAYKKHSKKFEETLKKSKAKEAKDFLESLQSKVREFSEGNG